MSGIEQQKIKHLQNLMMINTVSYSVNMAGV